MQLNKSHAIHAVSAVLIQTATFLVSANPWAGGLAGIMFFYGREHAQRQSNIAKQKGCSVKDLKPWEGLDFWTWYKDHNDSFWDLAITFPATGIAWWALPKLMPFIN